MISAVLWRKMSKEIVEGLSYITTAFLKKEGYFEDSFKTGTITWTSPFSEIKNSIGVLSYPSEDTIRLVYAYTDNNSHKNNLDYKVHLTTTKCNYGGKRYWLLCPLVSNGTTCNRRTSVLYLGGKYFGCRHCYNLTYDSRNVSGFQKQFGKIIGEYEFEKMRNNIKRKYYRGNMTRKYKRYLYLKHRNDIGFVKSFQRLTKGLK